MRKILLIEDRSQRQKLFGNENGIDFALYDDILENAIDEKYRILLDELKNDTFNFDNYSLIIAHKSAFEDNNISILKKIENHCKENKKTLVLFSGGIEGNYYHDENDYISIEITSKTLYSQNIKLFLEDFRLGNNNPLILSYGEDWKINILLNSLEKINYLLENNEKESIFYKRFVEDSKIELVEDLDLQLYQAILEGRKISKNEIIKVRDSIFSKIKELSNE